MNNLRGQDRLPGSVDDLELEDAETVLAYSNGGPAVMHSVLPTQPAPVKCNHDVLESVIIDEEYGKKGVVRRSMKRRASDPAVPTFFDHRDHSRALHIRHCQNSRKVLSQLTATLQVEDVMEDVVKRIDFGGVNNEAKSNGNIYAHIANINSVENERIRLKVAGSMSLEHVSEAWKDDDPIRMISKTSRVSRRVSTHKRPKYRLEFTDWVQTAIIGFLSLVTVIATCVWSQEGLLAGSDHLGHAVTANTRAGHVHAALYSTPAAISLQGTETEYFEVRLIAMAAMDFSQPSSHHRRLAERLGAHGVHSRRAAASSSSVAVTGNITYRLYLCRHRFYERTVQLDSTDELEDFHDVDVAKSLDDLGGGVIDGGSPIQAGESCNGQYFAKVTSVRSDSQETAFLLQVVRMGSAGRHRQAIGSAIFIVTFICIVSERIHRSYSAFLGASTALCTLSAIQETPHLHTVTGMIDWGTLMLLFSMMILMRMLAVSGFFNWFGLRVVILTRQKTTVLFFALTNLCGVLSMVLDNVTCVMLFGPLTFNLAKKMNLNPRPLYLSMAICATVGGTATLIGDPPNIVIGSKMKLGFEKFLIFNLPITAVVMLPLCSVMLYYRTRHSLIKDKTPAQKLDLVALKHENRITDMPMFAKLLVVLLAILLALLLSPIHKIEPAWFAVMGMFACAILFERHNFSIYLEFVEWDTLLFFALLFVLVETLSELGVIRMLGDWILAFIEVFPVESRMSMSIIIILWVAAFGSAFLESLPFTTTIVYVLIDLQRKTIEGVNPKVLVWPLSVGACVGGIGSIMGSSANLVCMAVSERFADKDEDKVQGGDFLRFGLPTMVTIVVFAMFWQLFIFVGLGVQP